MSASHDKAGILILIIVTVVILIAYCVKPQPVPIAIPAPLPTPTQTPIDTSLDWYCWRNPKAQKCAEFCKRVDCRE